MLLLSLIEALKVVWKWFNDEIVGLIGTFASINPTIVHIDWFRQKIDFRLVFLRTHATLYPSRISTFVPVDGQSQRHILLQNDFEDWNDEIFLKMKHK